MFISVCPEWVNIGPTFKTWQYKLTLSAAVLGNTSVGEGRTCVPVRFSMIKWICNEVFPWHLQQKTKRVWALYNCFSQPLMHFASQMCPHCNFVPTEIHTKKKSKIAWRVYTTTDTQHKQDKASQKMFQNCCLFLQCEGAQQLHLCVYVHGFIMSSLWKWMFYSVGNNGK